MPGTRNPADGCWKHRRGLHDLQPEPGGPIGLPGGHPVPPHYEKVISRGGIKPHRGAAGTPDRTETSRGRARHRHRRIRHQGRPGGCRGRRADGGAGQGGHPTARAAAAHRGCGGRAGSRFQLDRAGRHHVSRGSDQRGGAQCGQPRSGLAGRGRGGSFRRGDRAAGRGAERRGCGGRGRDEVRGRPWRDGHRAHADLRHRHWQCAVHPRSAGAQHRVRPYRDPRRGGREARL